MQCWLLPLVLAGKVSLAMYSAAQGIEAYVYEDKIEDADAGEQDRTGRLGQQCVL